MCGSPRLAGRGPLSRTSLSRNGPFPFGVRLLRAGRRREPGRVSCGTSFLRLHRLVTRIREWSRLRAWGTSVAKRRGMRRATVAVADHASHLGPADTFDFGGPRQLPQRRCSHLSAGRRSACRATAARTMGTVMVGHDCRGPNDTAFGMSRAVRLDSRSPGPHHGAAHPRADPGQKQDPAKSRFTRRRHPCSRGLGAGAPPRLGQEHPSSAARRSDPPLTELALLSAEGQGSGLPARQF